MGRQKRESTSVTKIFSDRLSDLVEEKKASGLNHNEICEQAGVGSGAMSDWLSDKKTANIDSLCKLAKYFNVSADWLLGISDVSSPDGELRQVCNYTGLEEEAIDFLHGLIADKDENGVYPAGFTDEMYTPKRFVNDFLSYDYLFCAIVELCDGINDVNAPDVDTSLLKDVQESIYSKYRTNSIYSLSRKELSLLRIDHAKSYIIGIIDSIVMDQEDKVSNN